MCWLEELDGSIHLKSLKFICICCLPVQTTIPLKTKRQFSRWRQFSDPVPQTEQGNSEGDLRTSAWGRGRISFVGWFGHVPGKSLQHGTAPINPPQRPYQPPVSTIRPDNSHLTILLTYAQGWSSSAFARPSWPARGCDGTGAETGAIVRDVFDCDREKNESKRTASAKERHTSFLLTLSLATSHRASPKLSRAGTFVRLTPMMESPETPRWRPVWDPAPSGEWELSALPISEVCGEPYLRRA